MIRRRLPDESIFGMHLDALLIAAFLFLCPVAIDYAVVRDGVSKAEFVTLLALVATFLVGELLRPDPEQERLKPSGLGDFDFPTAEQDRFVPVIWGQVRLSGPNVLWYGDLNQRAITQKVKTGLFSSKRIILGFQYDIGIQFGVCRGPDAELHQIFIDEEAVLPTPLTGEGTDTITELELFGGNDFGQGGIDGTVSWRPGSTTQTVNSYLDGTGELKIPTVTGQTPRFSGTAYLTWEQGYIGNSTNIKPWTFEVRRVANPLGLSVAGVNSDQDANPMNAAYELFTNTEWGLGIPASNIDTSAFSTAGDVLRTEGNGWSYIMDRGQSVQDVLGEIESQIDGVIFEDPVTGLWSVKLARPEAGPFKTITSPIAVQSYDSGDWSETTNVVSVSFSNRSNSYKTAPALATDSANAVLQGGGSFTSVRSNPTSATYPGVKDAALANQIAWRMLRTLSVPLIQARVVVDRSFWDVTPGDLVTWDDTTRGLDSVDFRVKRIDYGSLDSPGITLDLVEDIFQQSPGSYGNPPATQWDPPASRLLAFETADQVAMEAPRALVRRQNTGTTPEDPNISRSQFWASARQTNGAAGYDLDQRVPSGSGSFTTVETSFDFMLKGSLNANLAKGVANPSSITINATPDTQAAILAAVEANTDTADVGTNLINLCMIGNPASTQEELFLCTGASAAGANVTLTGCYRGVADTVQKSWMSGDPVYLMFFGGAISDDTFDATSTTDIRLVPRNNFGSVSTGFNDIMLTYATRARRPYPPGRISLEGTAYASTTSLEGTGSGAEGVGLDVEWIRRSHDAVDEIEVLSTDMDTLVAGQASSLSHTTELELFNDPDGSPTLLITTSGITGTSSSPNRVDILKQTNGVLPTRMRIRLSTNQQDVLLVPPGTTFFDSRYKLEHDFDVTSALTGQEEFGALDNGDESNIYTADAAGTHTFNLSSSFSVGDVEYDIDTGSGFPGTWGTLIAAGGTGPGTIAGVGVGDDIKIRHQSTDTSVTKQIDMTAPGAGTDAFGILFT